MVFGLGREARDTTMGAWRRSTSRWPRIKTASGLIGLHDQRRLIGMASFLNGAEIVAAEDERFSSSNKPYLEPHRLRGRTKFVATDAPDGGVGPATGVAVD
jgi:hypothetical protein